MSSDTLLQLIRDTPQFESQCSLLEENQGLLNDEFASSLKSWADQELRSDLTSSKQISELLLHLAHLTNDPKHRALGLLAMANTLSIGMADYTAAIKHYDEAAELYAEAGDLVNQARSQIGKLWSLASLGRNQEAIEAGQWAANVFEEHKEWKLLADISINLAAIHGHMGEDLKTLEMLDRARDLQIQVGDEQSPTVAFLEQNRSVVLRNLGRYKESIRASQLAHDLLMSHDQKVEAARAEQNLGMTYYVLGHFNDALQHLDSSRRVFLEDERHRDAARNELFTTDCLLELRRFSEVLERTTKLRDFFVGLGTQFEHAQSLLNESAALAGLGRHIDAIATSIEAEDHFSKIGNQLWQAIAMLSRSKIMLSTDNPREAISLTDEAFKIFEARQLPARAVLAQLIQAEAIFKDGRPFEAKERIEEVFRLTNEIDLPDLKQKCFWLLGLIEKEHGDPVQAKDRLKQAIDQVERMVGNVMSEFRMEFIEDKFRIYEEMVGLCMELGQADQAFEFSERAKSKVLVDLLAFRFDVRLRARDPVDVELVSELTSLRTQRDELFRRWFSREPEDISSEPDSALLAKRNVQEEILSREKRITQLWHRLLVHNADYASDISLWRVRTESVAPYLDDDTLLLEFFTVKDELILFLVDRNGITASPLSLKYVEVYDLIQLFWVNNRSIPRASAEQTVNSLPNVQKILARLYQHLLAPVHNRTSEFEQLIIVPHGVLHYLPFHALRRDSKYLLEDHAISYLPGASFLRYYREIQPSSQGALTLGHSNNDLLPYALEEASAVAAITDGESLLEEQATIKALNREARWHRIIHLATHGDFRPDNPLFSGLALEDGWLTTMDIFNLQLNASLVNLSACQTGRNLVMGGDQLVGLMRAFLYAGAATLIMSLWPVEDRSTANLMQRLYEKLMDGYTKAEALRDAQLDFIQAAQSGSDELDLHHTHPNYWAPFFLVGEAGEL